MADLSISGIYIIRHIDSGKVYIGSAQNIGARWRVHRHHLRRRTHHCAHLQSAYAKFGEAAFEWELLERVLDKKNLIEREQFYIDTYRAADRRYGYNSVPKAGSLLGWRPSDETRALWSKMRTGRKQSEETKRKRSEAMRGRKLSAEQCKQMSARQKGKTVPLEMRERIRQSLLGRPPSLLARQRSIATHTGRKKGEQERLNHRKGAMSFARLNEEIVKKIFQLTIGGLSCARTASALNIGSSTVHRVITRRGWHWIEVPPEIVAAAQSAAKRRKH